MSPHLPVAHAKSKAWLTVPSLTRVVDTLKGALVGREWGAVCPWRAKGTLDSSFSSLVGFQAMAGAWLSSPKLSLWLCSEISNPETTK